MEDRLKSKTTGCTAYWRSRDCYEQVRLYVKTQDNARLVWPHFVRLEVTLSGGGCQMAGVNRVGLLPHFINTVGLRRYLTPFSPLGRALERKLCVACSKDHQSRAAVTKKAAKQQAQLDRDYARWGSAWAAKNGHKIIRTRARICSSGKR